ncbi:MAG TPA: thymidine phosphorylase [Thermotogota bacterium]|nr:thymidine phosphorylase [Thermotogota bacterium]HRW92409.1 thymidine phosphorylase [Thermotogota bacterium]
MRAYDVILKKRDGNRLSREEIDFMVNGFVQGEITDYQMAAFLMAVFFRHMDPEESVNLTQSMRFSGDTIDLSPIPGVKVDKHSTGGVGDKTTLSLLPLVAACGVKVAKLSGRGLGHTGGTIDKLEAIPGFQTALPRERWLAQVQQIGLALAGQTANLVPADKKIYALRDVTATVDEISLIASSIMSKKLASGADAFVLDVKVGSGAFMQTLSDAQQLARLMVQIAELADKKACAVLTNMEEPLGRMVGNACEVYEAIQTLRGEGPEDFASLCHILGSKMVQLGLNVGSQTAENLLEKSLESGEALECFRKFVHAQGGDVSFVDHPEKLLEGPRQQVFAAPREGVITSMDTRLIGLSAMTLGAGRERKEDQIDHSVGFEFLVHWGDVVEEGQPLVKIFYNDAQRKERACALLEQAIVIGNSRVARPPLVFDIID